MLASLEDLDDYDVTARRDVQANVLAAATCALCGAEPLPADATFTQTAAWLERHHPTLATKIEMPPLPEPADRDAEAGRRALRATLAYDSQLRPGYAASIVTLQIAMASMDSDRRMLFADTFLAALCDICAAGAVETDDTLLRSYVNQWTDGKLEVAAAQPNWNDVNLLAGIVAAAARASALSAS